MEKMKIDLSELMNMVGKKMTDTGLITDAENEKANLSEDEVRAILIAAASRYNQRFEVGDIIRARGDSMNRYPGSLAIVVEVVDPEVESPFDRSCLIRDSQSRVRDLTDQSGPFFGRLLRSRIIAYYPDSPKENKRSVLPFWIENYEYDLVERGAFAPDDKKKKNEPEF